MKATVFAILLLVLSSQVFGASLEEQILEVSTINGAVLSDPIIGITNNGVLYLPILNLGKVLGSKIEQPGAGSFKIYKTELDTKDLNLEGCPKPNSDPACMATLFSKGTYFLAIDYFKNEMDWPIEADLKALRITVNTGGKSKDLYRKASGEERPLKISRKRFDYPAGRIEATGSNDPGLNSLNVYESQPLFEQDSDILFSKTPQQSNLRWTLSKEMVENNPPYNIRNYELFSTQTLDTKYLFSPTQVTGFAVSNIKRNETIFDTQNLYEKGPPRWRVELYVNETYLGETFIDNEGNFGFTNIPVFYGQNKIRYHLVSPVGKTLDIERNYNVGNEFEGKGKLKYQASFGQKVNDSSYIGSGIINYGITQGISTQLGYAQFQQLSTFENKKYSLAGVSFLQPQYSLSASNISSTDSKEHAWIISPKFNLGALYVFTEYTKFENFRSQLINPGVDDQQTSLKRVSMLSLIPTAIPVTAQLSFLENGYANINSVQQVQARAFAMRNSNSLLVESNKFWPSPANPDLYVEYGNYNPLFRSRWGVQIQDDRYSKSKIEIESLLPDSYFLTFSMDSPVRFGDASYAVGLSRVFYEIQLETNAIKTPTQNVYTVTLSSNMKYTEKGLKLSNEENYRQADIEIFAFVDENSNGKYDEGEKPYPRLRVLHTQRQKEYETDSTGNVRIPSVSPYERLSLEIVKESISNIFLTAQDFQTDYVLTPAQQMRIEIPIKPSFDVKGTVKNSYYKKLLPMEILDSENKVIGFTTSTAEGRYKFTDLSAGLYFVRINPEFMKVNKLVAEPSGVAVDVNGKAGVRAAEVMSVRALR